MDARHVHIQELPGSCGVVSLSQFNSSVDQILFALASYLYHPSRGQPCAFVVWSDINHEGAFGELLWEHLTKKLKFVNKIALRSFPEENPKTGNIIRVYTWAIPHEQFREWYKQERIERIKKQ